MSNFRRELKRNRDLLNTLRDIKRLERAHECPREGKPRSERRRERRDKSLPTDRVCPLCKGVKLKSRQWVVVNGRAMCKSCWMLERAPVR